MDLEDAVEKRRTALRILERAARGQGFAQLFADTAALAKDRESSFEELLGVFYGLLSDLLELNAGVRAPLLRNPHLSKELETLARSVDPDWIGRADLWYGQTGWRPAPQSESATRPGCPRALSRASTM